MDWKKMRSIAQAGLSAAMADVGKKSDEIRKEYQRELRRRDDHEILNAKRRADEGSLPSWKVEMIYDEVRRRGL